MNTTKTIDDLGPFAEAAREAVEECLQQPPFPTSWYDDPPDERVRSEALEMIADGCDDPAMIAGAALDWKGVMYAERDRRLAS